MKVRTTSSEVALDRVSNDVGACYSNRSCCCCRRITRFSQIHHRHSILNVAIVVKNRKELEATAIADALHCAWEPLPTRTKVRFDARANDKCRG